jgi:alkanesulfonate monooxygenase SsuD/methylene tetrahydromethanopterin reductase-like flavin-dependent oxidoreductase (luciferase family)
LWIAFAAQSSRHHAGRVHLGLMSIPGDERAVLADVRLAADAGFDLIATADHLRHPRDPTVPGLDGWSVLAAWAVASRGLRLAMLVSNIIYRHPVVVAKQAITVDRLSGGRVDLGVGTGVYPTDHAMAGVPAWSPSERVQRLREFVQALDAALRGSESFEGAHYGFRDGAWAPGPLHRPRPPIAIGAVGPRMLHQTAALADVWSAFGGLALESEAAVWAALARQSQILTQCCESIGRDPGSLRRSLLAFRPLVPWSRRGALEQIVQSARSLGFAELIVYKPADDQERRVFDDVNATLAALKTL